MLYAVDFDIKVNQRFCTVHTAFIHASSVSECMNKAEEIKESLPANKSHQVHIFIEG